MTYTSLEHPGVGLTLPALLLAGLLAVIAGEAGLLRFPRSSDATLAPTTVTVPPRAFTYREGGEFVQGTRTVDAPLVSIGNLPPLDIMKYEVSAADYLRCVADGACKPATPRRHVKGDVPVTGVSFKDATSYAVWLSAKTGQIWRLPTIAEWTFAAGSKAVDDAVGVTSADPSERWLLTYDAEFAGATTALASPQPLGSFGENEYGVADLSGVVWEWTSSCGGRTALGPSGEAVTHLDSCGVRYLEGRHRSAMNIFVRDAATGGCSAGAPPDNLGFRLVRAR
jgi:formylglycine-generating enzyme required for sulfatase activity